MFFRDFFAPVTGASRVTLCKKPWPGGGRTCLVGSKTGLRLLALYSVNFDPRAMIFEKLDFVFFGAVSTVRVP